MEGQNWLAGWLEEEEPYDTLGSDFVKGCIKSSDACSTEHEIMIHIHIRMGIYLIKRE